MTSLSSCSIVQGDRAYDRRMWAHNRVLVMVLVVGCGGGDDGGVDEGLDPPTCQPDSVLRYVHDLNGTLEMGELPPGNYAFVNKLGDDPGSLQVGDANGTEYIRVEFDRLVADGSTVDAGGLVELGALALGNCDTDRPGRFTALSGDGWSFTLVDLREAPYCDQPPRTGSFAACLIPEPI